MKKLVAVCAAVLFVGALVVPVIVQAQQAPAAKSSPKAPRAGRAQARTQGYRSPDVRKSKKKTATSPPPPKVQPKGTEGPASASKHPRHEARTSGRARRSRSRGIQGSGERWHSAPDGGSGGRFRPIAREQRQPTWPDPARPVLASDLHARRWRAWHLPVWAEGVATRLQE